MTGLASRVLAIAVFIAGCATTRTIIDKIKVPPLSSTAFHQQLTDKAQCMHCHTEVATAPAVPHPQYKNCAVCHVSTP